MKLIGNRQNERAFLAGVLLSGQADRINPYDELDFVFERFMFIEIRAMIEMGEPFDNPVAVPRWFTSAESKARAEAAGISNPTAHFAEVLREASTIAHIDYHGRSIRKDRISRELQLFAVGILERIDHGLLDPLAELGKQRDLFDEIWELAEEANAEGTL